ncbi:bifunctional 2',3'-cyclic-nucleotide 2'-phosphodiesterase/3'-nucleotidase [Pseudorhodobacter turbinis]|uniref:Bifunctional 2',3'-cyclic-nucleotide 2'-phosphodiesterase/3'-nucleotidase n=1 Tax=Pseudorhodobacter turbinis TaxID=2500533 RepID=A0A4P8EHK9_9RHOB|nr:bifunctional 2',3'-cyclic-nucleotide 2'-phosphodiesterase/3'-nucleotidase [Pseudorhodobacter turbinis]QCO56233.1 bifunctional 2',3'-cyclic-nucleotide 2'-phosphodiesterase/3'-nucleotidase [Pseudorhodobacter turbinis]
MTSSTPLCTGITGEQATLRIMQTGDLHAHVFPFDYDHDHPIDTLGFARTASLITAARKEVSNSILLDNGDFLQGSALGDYVAYDRGLRDGDLHPVIAAMNAMRYDAATLGNHEFNFGLPFMMAALRRSQFPFVSANTLIERGNTPLEDKRLLPPYAMLDRRIRDTKGKPHPIRIGILGLLPPQITTWDETQIGGKIFSRDMVETAAALIPEMKAAGADLVVVLAHSGIGEATHSDGMENAAYPLARLPGVDALVTGHTHMVFPSQQFANMQGIDLARGTVEGTPTVMAGFWGSHLGLIDLFLERKDGRWRVLDSQSSTRTIAKTTPDRKRIALVESSPRVLRAVQHHHDATLDYMRYPVGETLAPIHSYFALVKDCTSVQLICQAQQRFVAQKMKQGPHSSLPVLSAAAPFKVGGWGGPDNYTNIPPGPLHQRNLSDLYCFPNTICALRLRGADILDWLERSAGIFNHITRGKHDQPLLNDAFPSYSFDVIYGVTYQIDPSQPPRYCAQGKLINPHSRRIRNLHYQGKPLDLDAYFLVATNNYRSSTRAAVYGTNATELVFAEPVNIRTILYNEVTEKPFLDARPLPNWSIAPMSNTSFTFETSPDAARFLADLGNVWIDHLGEDANGFGRYRLWP